MKMDLQPHTLDENKFKLAGFMMYRCIAHVLNITRIIYTRYM